MDSWAIYPTLFGLSLIDALIPLLPSEAPLIMAGVYAASTGHPVAILAAVSAGLGAALGDHTTYAIGRRFGPGLQRLDPASRPGRALSAAHALLERRGPTALIVGRFIPWGRIAVNLLMGATRIPWRTYAIYDLMGVGAWAVYSVGVGYLGGVTFERNPVAGVALGVAVAVSLTAVIELVRAHLRRRRGSPVDAGDQPQAVADLPREAAALGEVVDRS